jgi:hypothetical protein
VALIAAGVLLDQIREAAFVIEAEARPLDADHVSTPAPAMPITSSVALAMRNGPTPDGRALEARQQNKVRIVVDGGAAAHIGDAPAWHWLLSRQ